MPSCKKASHPGPVPHSSYLPQYYFSVCLTSSGDGICKPDVEGMSVPVAEDSHQYPCKKNAFRPLLGRNPPRFHFLSGQRQLATMFPVRVNTTSSVPAPAPILLPWSTSNQAKCFWHLPHSLSIAADSVSHLWPHSSFLAGCHSLSFIITVFQPPLSHPINHSQKTG